MSKSTYEVYTANGPYTSQAAKVSTGTAPGGSASKPAASHTGNGAPTVIPGAAPGSATPGQSLIEGVTVGSMPVVNEINVKQNPDGTIGANVLIADAMPVTGPGVSNHTSPVSGGSPGSGVVGVQTGWVKLGNGFKYYKEDGSGYKTGWHSEYAADGSKVWYYFDEDPGNKEWMVTGWKRIKGSKDEKWYYFRSDGKMSIYWKKLDDLWYYLEPQEDAGYMVMGWKEINGYWYYFVPEEDAGYMMVDWHKIGGKWYYFYKTEDKYGIMAANDMINHTDGKKYYLASDGAMVTKATMPQVVFSGVTYAVAEDGACSEIGNSTSQIIEKIGFISAKYEAGGFNPGAVSSGKGDHGGVSYGVPQFSTTKGSADKFVAWLKMEYPDMGSYFNGCKAGTDEFSNAWKMVANTYGDEFGYIQTTYEYNTVISVLIDKAKNKYGIDYGRSVALRELIYSTGVQFHCGSLGLSVLGNVNSSMDDEQIINASYQYKINNYKSLFKSSSPQIQESVKNRFINEWKDVLALIE